MTKQEARGLSWLLGLLVLLVKSLNFSLVDLGHHGPLQFGGGPCKRIRSKAGPPLVPTPPQGPPSPQDEMLVGLIHPKGTGGTQCQNRGRLGWGGPRRRYNRPLPERPDTLLPALGPAAFLRGAGIPALNELARGLGASCPPRPSSPSSPPTMEKSVWRMVHLTILALSELTSALAASIP